MFYNTYQSECLEWLFLKWNSIRIWQKKVWKHSTVDMNDGNQEISVGFWPTHNTNTKAFSASNTFWSIKWLYQWSKINIHVLSNHKDFSEKAVPHVLGKHNATPKNCIWTQCHQMRSRLFTDKEWPPEYPICKNSSGLC